MYIKKGIVIMLVAVLVLVAVGYRADEVGLETNLNVKCPRTFLT